MDRRQPEGYLRLCLHTDDVPDIQRRSKGKHESREQDRRRSPLELSVFTVVHIDEGYLGKEADGEYKVDDGKYYVVDHALDLHLCGVPSGLAPHLQRRPRLQMPLQTSSSVTQMPSMCSLSRNMGSIYSGSCEAR